MYFSFSWSNHIVCHHLPQLWPNWQKLSIHKSATLLLDRLLGSAKDGQSCHCASLIQTGIKEIVWSHRAGMWCKCWCLFGIRDSGYRVFGLGVFIGLYRMPCSRLKCVFLQCFPGSESSLLLSFFLSLLGVGVGQVHGCAGFLKALANFELITLNGEVHQTWKLWVWDDIRIFYYKPFAVEVHLQHLDKQPFGIASIWESNPTLHICLMYSIQV